MQSRGIEAEKVANSKNATAAIWVNRPNWIKRCVSKRVSNQARNLVSKTNINVAVIFGIVDRGTNRVLDSNSHKKSRGAM